MLHLNCEVKLLCKFIGVQLTAAKEDQVLDDRLAGDVSTCSRVGVDYIRLCECTFF